MPDPTKTHRTRIRPLKDQLILYVDNSAESGKAKDLLESAGISPFITDGPVEPLDEKPLVIYNGGYYKGLQEIRDLVDLLEFWSNQSPLIHCSVFTEAE